VDGDNRRAGGGEERRSLDPYPDSRLASLSKRNWIPEEGQVYLISKRPSTGEKNRKFLLAAPTMTFRE